MTKNLKIKIKSINNDISIPSYETNSSAGLDLRAYLPEGNTVSYTHLTLPTSIQV